MKEVILSSCAAFVFVYILGFQRFKRGKPFSCETCMAGWFCLGLSIGVYKWYYIPFYMAAAMCATIALTAYLKKI